MWEHFWVLIKHWIKSLVQIGQLICAPGDVCACDYFFVAARISSNAGTNENHII